MDRSGRSTYNWATFYGQTHVNFPPLFGHQYSHVWIDFRGIQDAYMRGKGIDYFENSRRATILAAAVRDRQSGAVEGLRRERLGTHRGRRPLDTTFVIDGRSRQFHTYTGAGRGGGRDHGRRHDRADAAGGSVPFAPEIAIPALDRDAREVRRQSLYQLRFCRFDSIRR